MPETSLLIVFAIAWVGHFCLWTSLLSHLFGRALPKPFLKAWRLLTAFVILGFPLLIREHLNAEVWWYVWPCAVGGGIIFPVITVARLLRKPSGCIVSESTVTRDLWPELGQKLIGDGNLSFVARLPGNGLFRVDFTDITLALPELPPEWEGLTLLVVSDVHFHGTPARAFFDRVMDELLAGPKPDLVCLIGDYVDTDSHHTWIPPVLGRLAATEAKLAILGNHDRHHHPTQVRDELTAAGYTVFGNSWQVVTIRGVSCVVVGHEGPWFAPPPDLSGAPPGLFRLCLSHTPDNFYWGIRNRIGLMLCGHVHGGAIRVPVIGSIFVPSVYGRRFDYGIFEKRGMVMVVNRGLSGKEPVRIRCNPQVMRVKLVRPQ
ncbi:MAG: metallophosphoesterase [Planctomycetes bacterium]|nr:metallophosphoesterase [Planctomycetota bacterium]